jgi:2-polyprenyl-6-hydroxyphenyl methylase/3-demethylubiquinone-9 3-methyltransferase
MEACNGLHSLDIIDIGCGGGILAESMALAGGNVTGIDMAKESLEVAKLHKLDTRATCGMKEADLKLNYQFSSAEDFAQDKPEQFDVVTCLEMLEHVPSPGSVIESCAKLVKPDGWVFFSTLNRNSKAYGLAIVGAEYLLGLVPKGTHDFNKFIKPSELLNMSERYGLIPRKMTGLHYNPLNKSYFLSDRNVDVNYIVGCQKV